MLKVHNSFDENNIKKTDNKNKASSKISFTGHKVVENDYGEKQYRFFIPDISVAPDKIKLLVAHANSDKDGNYHISQKGSEPDTKEFSFEKGKNYIDIPFSKFGLCENECLGYKFVVNDKDFLDTSTVTFDRKWNITTPANRVLLQQGRPMIHIVPDMILSKKNIDKNPKNIDEKKILSSKIGGNFDDIMERIPDFYNLGARRILSTPIFGQDNVSSHGYWTTNPFQITNSMGDIAKFKKMNVELYKKGMGWIADGAFVNEGIEGIHVEHISKWGGKSPYANWITSFGFPDKPFKFGILSKKEDVNKNYLGIKLINAPKKLVVTEYGSEKWIDNEVDKTQPSYVQIYDKRLASVRQVNSDEVIRKYDKSAKDPHEINNYQDTIMPYRIKINPEEVQEKYKHYIKSENINMNKGKEHSPFKNFLVDWKNFGETSSDDDAGSILWVGNKDILKLRFMLTDEEAAKLSEKDLKKTERAVAQVQDHIMQVGEFWTKEIAASLQTHIAKQLDNAETPEDFFEKIQEGVQANQLPKSAENVTKAEIENVLDDVHEHKDLATPETLLDGILSYPLDAIEFNPSTCGILGSPYLKKLALREDQIGKSRIDIYRENRENEYNNIPKEYREIHQEMDKLLTGEVRDVAVDILKKIQDENKIKVDLIDPHLNQLTDEGKEVYGLISNDITKFIFTQSLLNTAYNRSPDLFNEDEYLEPNYKNTNFLEYNNNLLSKVSPESLKLKAETPKLEAMGMIKAIREGAANITKNDKKEFAEYLANRLEGVNPDSLKLAKFLLAKTEGGLEWRIDAAKDVAPVEAINDNKADMESNWDKTIKFWKKFTDGVRKYNPKSYEILEVTDESQLVAKNKAEKEDRKYFSAHDASLKLIQGSGATTPTNYNYFYSFPHSLYSSDTEKWGHAGLDSLAEKLIHGWEGGKSNNSYGHLLGNTPDTSIQAHNMISNHDKPRPAHGFGLDMKIFFQSPDSLRGWANSSLENLEKEPKGDEYAESAIKVVKNKEYFYGEPADFSKIDGKALSMGLAIKTSIDKSYEFKKLSPEHQQDIHSALKALVNGKYTKADGTKGEYDAEYFGVRPYDVNIKDVIIEAKRTSKNNFAKVNTKILEKELLASMLVPALKKTRAATGFLVAMPGNPTIYAGDEIGETGFETKSKNAYGQDRNANHYGRVDKESSSFIQEIYDAKNDIAKVFNLRNDKAFSPLVDGSTILLKQPDKDTGVVYRYNENKDMFVILNNKGFGMTAERAGINEGDEPLSLPFIDLSEQMQIKQEINVSGSEPVKSILSYLKDGTEYKNALKKDDDSVYKIETLGDKKVLKRADGQPITMRGSDLFLYRTDNFDGSKNEPSFSGNPHIKLQNTKYRFSV